MMAQWWNTKRFDLIEVGLVTVVVVFAVWNIESSRVELHPEARPLAERYGPERNSENEEEWIIRDFFHDRREGVFVDIGAGHYREFSNTYFLEHQLGWSGLAVEPMQIFEADYREHRQHTRFFPFFVSDVSSDTVTMYTLGDDFLGNSSDKEFVKRFGDKPKEMRVPTITLNDLLDREHVSSIDFMSMDIELSEPKALAGFDIERFRPALVCIEAHPEVRQQILDYFARHGYVVVAKYLRADDKNLYFAPLK
jgi:FkbM family methyltransferase